MLRCVKELGLRGRTRRSHWERLAGTPLPAIAVMRNGHFVLLAKFSGETVLVQDPLQPRPTLMKRKDFEGA
jgi:subfamily B ATP-binding cassette protein HlyB/CyaB